jgi:hypothetical protein
MACSQPGRRDLSGRGVLGMDRRDPPDSLEPLYSVALTAVVELPFTVAVAVFVLGSVPVQSHSPIDDHRVSGRRPWLVTFSQPDPRQRSWVFLPVCHLQDFPVPPDLAPEHPPDPTPSASG